MSANSGFCHLVYSVLWVWPFVVICDNAVLKSARGLIVFYYAVYNLRFTFAISQRIPLDHQEDGHQEDVEMTVSFPLQNGVPNFLKDMAQACQNYPKKK